MKLYYINSYFKRSFVDVDKSDQLFAKEVQDIHTGGKKYLI